MSDLISLSRGAEPWRPTSSTELVDHKGDPFDQLVRQIQMNAPGRIALVIEGEGVVACADAMDFPGDLGTALNELVERYKEMVERFSRTENEVNDLANTPADLVSA